MPSIITRGAFSAGALGFGASQGSAVYVEDVFSTYLYTGTNASLSINNSIDLSTKGGLTWIKGRSSTSSHQLFDTARGVNVALATNTTGANDPSGPTYSLTSFNNNGFTLGLNYNGTNVSNVTYASWTFRKQPKFFDVITWTGDGVNGRVISHNLGVSPAVVLIKRTDTTGPWVWNDKFGNALRLNDASASGTGNLDGGYTGFANYTSTTFTLSSYGSGIQNINANGGTYVAYVFASDAGGFGAAGTDSIISYGSYSGTSAEQTITLGWEPQFLLIKASNNASQTWIMFDNMRGLPAAPGNAAYLYPNSTNSENQEYGPIPFVGVSSTGFTLPSGGYGYTNASGINYIYLAIRRGPMKTPTDATKVYTPVVFTGNSTANTQITSGFVTDWFFDMQRVGSDYWNVFDRLRGYNKRLLFQLTSAEDSPGSYYSYFDNMTGVKIGDGTGMNGSGKSFSAHMFRRAPGFFDCVCYSGTGSATTVSHNLGVVPEMMIVKYRSSSAVWVCYNAATGNNANTVLNLDIAAATQGSVLWNSTTPTASVFSIGTNAALNTSGGTYVAYLFATCPGVSKVGTYTGTGASQAIACGFSAGARFVLIKRTDSTGDWYVYDTARGMSSGADPYLFINSTAAETTGTDYVDSTTGGFTLTASAPAGLNANGGTYIFLAVA